MWVAWNKEKDLDKAVWVNQVVLFLQSFCFTIEPLAFQANSIKLCRSRWYCSCLTYFGSIFPFIPPENIKNLWFSDVSKGYGKLTLMMMISCFCGMVDRRKAFCLISSRDHSQRSSPSWISDTLQAGFESVQNLSSGFVEWNCAVVIHHGAKTDLNWLNFSRI